MMSINFSLKALVCELMAAGWNLAASSWRSEVKGMAVIDEKMEELVRMSRLVLARE